MVPSALKKPALFDGSVRNVFLFFFFFFFFNTHKSLVMVVSERKGERVACVALLVVICLRRCLCDWCGLFVFLVVLFCCWLCGAVCLLMRVLCGRFEGSKVVLQRQARVEKNETQRKLLRGPVEEATWTTISVGRCARVRT